MKVQKNQRASIGSLRSSRLVRTTKKRTLRNTPEESKGNSCNKQINAAVHSCKQQKFKQFDKKKIVRRGRPPLHTTEKPKKKQKTESDNIAICMANISKSTSPTALRRSSRQAGKERRVWNKNMQLLSSKQDSSHVVSENNIKNYCATKDNKSSETVVRKIGRPAKKPVIVKRNKQPKARIKQENSEHQESTDSETETAESLRKVETDKSCKEEKSTVDSSEDTDSSQVNLDNITDNKVTSVTETNDVKHGPNAFVLTESNECMTDLHASLSLNTGSDYSALKQNKEFDKNVMQTRDILRECLEGNSKAITPFSCQEIKSKNTLTNRHSVNNPKNPFINTSRAKSKLFSSSRVNFSNCLNNRKDKDTSKAISKLINMRKKHALMSRENYINKSLSDGVSHFVLANSTEANEIGDLKPKFTIEQTKNVPFQQKRVDAASTLLKKLKLNSNASSGVNKKTKGRLIADKYQNQTTAYKTKTKATNNTEPKVKNTALLAGISGSNPNSDSEFSINRIKSDWDDECVTSNKEENQQEKCLPSDSIHSKLAGLVNYSPDLPIANTINKLKARVQSTSRVSAYSSDFDETSVKNVSEKRFISSDDETSAVKNKKKKSGDSYSTQIPQQSALYETEIISDSQSHKLKNDFEKKEKLNSKCSAAQSKLSSVSFQNINNSLASSTKLPSAEVLQDDTVSLSVALAQLVDGPECVHSTQQTVTIHPAQRTSTDSEFPAVSFKTNESVSSENSVDHLQNKQSSVEVAKPLNQKTVSKSSVTGKSDDKEKESSQNVGDDEKENQSDVSGQKKQIPLLIRVPHRPLVIKTPLKCPECCMQFCTVRSLLWHFGFHLSGNMDPVCNSLLEGLEYSWEGSVPSTASCAVTSMKQFQFDGKHFNAQKLAKKNNEEMNSMYRNNDTVRVEYHHQKSEDVYEMSTEITGNGGRSKAIVGALASKRTKSVKERLLSSPNSTEHSSMQHHKPTKVSVQKRKTNSKGTISQRQNSVTKKSAEKESTHGGRINFAPKSTDYDTYHSQVIPHNTPLVATSTGVVATIVGTHTIQTKQPHGEILPLDLAIRDKSHDSNDVILKVPIPRLLKAGSSQGQIIGKIKENKKVSSTLKDSKKFVSILPKPGDSLVGGKPISQDHSTDLITTKSTPSIVSPFASLSSHVTIHPISPSSSNSYNDRLREAKKTDLLPCTTITPIPAPRLCGPKHDSKQPLCATTGSMHHKSYSSNLKTISRNSFSEDSILKDEGIVMINSNLGLRIVSTEPSAAHRMKSTMPSTKTPFLNPQSFTLTPDSGIDSLTIVPQSGCEFTKTRTASTSPDILTIVPQIKKSSKTNTPTAQIMTAAGKVSTSNVVKLVLLPQEDKESTESIKSIKQNVKTAVKKQNSPKKNLASPLLNLHAKTVLQNQEFETMDKKAQTELRHSENSPNLSLNSELKSPVRSEKRDLSGRKSMRKFSSCTEAEDDDSDDCAMVIDDDARESEDHESMDPMALCSVQIEEDQDKVSHNRSSLQSPVSRNSNDLISSSPAVSLKTRAAIASSSASALPSESAAVCCTNGSQIALASSAVSTPANSLSLSSSSKTVSVVVTKSCLNTSVTAPLELISTPAVLPFVTPSSALPLVKNSLVNPVVTTATSNKNSLISISQNYVTTSNVIPNSNAAQSTLMTSNTALGRTLPILLVAPNVASAFNSIVATTSTDINPTDSTRTQILQATDKPIVCSKSYTSKTLPSNEPTTLYPIVSTNHATAFDTKPAIEIAENNTTEAAETRRTNGNPKRSSAERRISTVERGKYESRKYVCQHCSRRFGWSTDLKRHIILHTGERPFKCQYCQNSFTRKFLMQNHISRVHPDKSIKGSNLVKETASAAPTPR